MVSRETRSSWRRIALYTACITLGVAALVAINSFRSDMSRAIHREARALLGADLELRSREPFPQPVQNLLDSAVQAGTPVSYVTSFSSMALVERSGRTRLVEVRALAGGYPYYGQISTEPAGRWTALASERVALVDPSVLVQLDASLGDTVRIGQADFPIDAAVTTVPGEIGIRAAIGPRVYIPGAYLDETELLRFGSRARYAAYLQIEDAEEVQQFLDEHEDLLEDQRVGYDTVEEREEAWAESLDVMARFLGLVGLMALLLGGLGVASAAHVFVRRKLETVAVLRCLGATQRTVFLVYLLQAALMGVLGAAAGAALGIGVQAALPRVLADFLPLDVSPRLHGLAVLSGFGIGVWVALLFGLLPLLTVRDVPPLRALRRPFDEPTPRRDVLRVAAYVVLVGSIIALSLWQAPFVWAGLAFAGGVAMGASVLWAVAAALIKATRRFFPDQAPYVVRQGVANLFRPHNQTVAVTLAVGFGVFLLSTMHLVQRNLLTQIEIETGPDRPNLVVFDIQADQREGVEHLISERGLGIREVTPIVPARIAEINDRTVEELLADTVGPRASRWALRREYRHTYRDTMVASEQLAEGEWWGSESGGGGGGGAEGGRERQEAAGAVPAAEPAGEGVAAAEGSQRREVHRVSMEVDLAAELRVEVGDRITWDVQGVRLETEIASLRHVDWARFEPNFFVVFEPGALEQAPQTYVTLVRVPAALERAELQRDLVRRYPNISALDLSLIIETLDRILGSVSSAIRFMAVFSLASGLIVLLGAIATSRFQRLRESVLLRTLGARTKQVGKILVTEYFALGALAALTGTLLAGVAGWGLVTFFFEMTFRLPVLTLVWLFLGAAMVTTVIGLLGSLEVFRKQPLAVMRQLGE